MVISGETFVTRKVSLAVAAISLGLQDCVTLGNLDTLRDWGGRRQRRHAMLPPAPRHAILLPRRATPRHAAPRHAVPRHARCHAIPLPLLLLPPALAGNSASALPQ